MARADTVALIAALEVREPAAELPTDLVGEAERVEQSVLGQLAALVGEAQVEAQTEQAIVGALEAGVAIAIAQGEQEIVDERQREPAQVPREGARIGLEAPVQPQVQPARVTQDRCAVTRHDGAGRTATAGR